jgi:predicted Rdx family selenoprotein
LSLACGMCVQCYQCLWIVRSFLIARSNVASVYGLSVHSWLPDPMLPVSMDCPFILDCPIQCCQCRWIVRSFLIARSNVASVYGLSVHSWLPVSMDCPFILDCPIQCCQCLWIVRSFLIARSNVASVYGLSVHSWTRSFINTCWQFLLLSWRLIRYHFLNVGDGWKCLLNVNMSTHATLYNHQDIW